MEEKEEFYKGLAVLFIAILTIFMMFIGMFFQGFILSKMWKWFIIPMFGVKNYSIVYFIGFSLTVAFLTKSITIENKKNQEEDPFEAIKKILILTLYQLSYFGIAFVIKLFL